MLRREFVTGASAVGALGIESPAREAALAVLKPSRKELEHGLELHSSSLVIEPYGFSPRSAVDGDALRRAIEGGASELEVQDLTEEMSMTRCVSQAQEREAYLRAWEAAGITCIFQNAGEESQDPLRLMKRLARFTYVTDLLRGHVSKAVMPDDIAAAKKESRRCLYMSANGVPLVEQWVSVEDELRYIRVFFQLGVRMMHLTYNRRNMIGDGCAEPANAGLSDFGRAAVGEMNRVGVIVDVAHSGWRTSLEAVQASRAPAVASHSCCAALHRHMRAKPDEVIRAIADRDGLLGICAVSGFLGGEGDIGVMLNHADYVAKRFGVDHVALATDLAYSSPNADAEYRKVPRLRRSRAQWEGFWPPGTYPSRQHPSLAWINWPLFTVGLVQRGYPDRDIEKIIGGNALRVARAVWAARA